jgi:hypothetical protein
MRLSGDSKESLVFALFQELLWTDVSQCVHTQRTLGETSSPTGLCVETRIATC